MDRCDLGNGAALLLSCVLATTFGWQHRPAPSLELSASTAHPLVASADGSLVPSADYRRIISLDPAIDDALAEMGQAPRLLAISAYSAQHASRKRFLQQVPHQLATGASLEDIVALHGDLVLVTSSSDAVRSRRLREGHLPVFDCGNQATVAGTAAAIRAVSQLIGQPDLGAQLATRIQARIARVADPHQAVLSACYVADYQGSLFGGAEGTNLHEVITAAGMSDAASAHGWKDYPVYRLEDLVAMAPQVVVTASGMGPLLRALPGAQRIPAIAQGRIIEIDPDLLMITGIGELEATEALCAARRQLP